MTAPKDASDIEANSRNGRARRRKDQQDALRDYLRERGKLEYVFDNIERMEGEGADMKAMELNALKTANDQRIRLLDKYLPSLKAEEITTIDKDGLPTAVMVTIKRD